MLNKIIESSFENLAQSLRILSEAIIKAHFFGLLKTDRAEAIGNIEIAYMSILNGFHSLYDAIEKQLLHNPIDWYKTPELATILVLRNARHHNQANKIRTIYAYHLVKAKAKYVFVDFPMPEEDASTMELYISWEDFKTLLSQDKTVTKIKDETVSLINTYLNTKLFNEYTKHYKVSENKIFLNVVPLFVNAGNKIMPFIKDYCNHDSTESKLFKALFLNGIIANTQKHEVNCGTILI